MATVLVTGGSGFIGRNLIEALLFRGDRVRCLVRNPATNIILQDLGAELVIGDLHDHAALQAAVADTDVVIHLAGMIAALRKTDLMRVNRDGTANLADAISVQANPPLLLLVSSLAAAGPAPRGQIRIESDPPAPISDYGHSKLAGEQEAIARAAKYPLTILRPGCVFGPYDRHTLPLFKTIQRLRCHPVAGRRHPPLSWIHVADLIDLISLAIDRGERVPAAAAHEMATVLRELSASQNGAADKAAAPQEPSAHTGAGVYFAAAPEHPSYAEFGSMTRRMLFRPYMPVIACPDSFAWFLASVSERISHWRGKANVFNRDKIREALAESWACSPDKAHRQLGFEPAAPLLERVQQTIDWYRQQGWLW